MNGVDKALIDALKGVLPEIQAKAITKQLEEKSDLLNENKTLKNEVERNTKSLNDLFSEKYKLSATIVQLRDEIEKNAEQKEVVDKLEIELEKRERNFDIELLKKELEMQKQLNDNMFKIMSIAFASPVYQQSVSGFAAARGSYGNIDHLPFSQTVRNEIVPHSHDVISDNGQIAHAAMPKI